MGSGTPRGPRQRPPHARATWHGTSRAVSSPRPNEREAALSTAAFLGSGRRMRATVAPPTTVNRACYWRRNLIELRTLGPATLASATGHESRIETSDYDAMSGASSASDQGERGRLVR